MSKSDWSFEWITSWDEVWSPAFRAQWKAWVTQSPTSHVFFEPAIVQAWHDTYRPMRPIQPRFSVARHSSGNAVFLPLVYDRGGWKDAWQRSIMPAGHCEFDYHDPIAVGQVDAGLWASYWPALEADLANRWKGTFETISLGRLRGGVLPGQLTGQQVDVVPWMDCGGMASLDEILTGGKRKRVRGEFRAKTRDLDQAGPSSLECFSPSETDKALASVEGFIDSHSLRWPDSSTPGDYYRNLIRLGCPDNTVHMSELRHLGKPISWRLNLTHKKEFLHYVQTYDEAAQHYYPGLVHCCRLIELAVSQGYEVMNLGRGDELWKLKFTDAMYPLYTRGLDSASLRASMSRAWQQTIRPCVVQAKRRIFPRSAKA
jgi:CelD/BcsL family acetyltransferase involved in cellulose biosynthesis